MPARKFEVGDTITAPLIFLLIYVQCAVGADPDVPGSIPGAIRFSDYQRVWNGVHSALVRINEELFERKLAVPV
jgi:hypothetical protein